MIARAIRQVAVVGLGATFAVATPPAAEIKVTPVVAAGQVFVSFTAPEALGPDLHELVRSGLLMTLAFTIDLSQPSSAWFDRTLAQVHVSSSVKYDNLTGVYHVSRLRDGHVVWSERTDDFAAVRTELTTFDRVPIATDGLLEPNAEYYVQVRMRASPRRTFPLWPWSSDDGSGRAAFTFIR
jgi:hypothetical protein